MASSTAAEDYGRIAWQPERPDDALPLLPPTGELETRAVLVEHRRGIGSRQAASRYLHGLVAAGVLREVQFGREKLFLHPRLLDLLTRDSNEFPPY